MHNGDILMAVEPDLGSKDVLDESLKSERFRMLCRCECKSLVVLWTGLAEVPRQDLKEQDAQNVVEFVFSIKRSSVMQF